MEEELEMRLVWSNWENCQIILAPSWSAPRAKGDDGKGLATSSESLPQPTHSNTLISRGAKQGKEGKKNILDGYYFHPTDLKDTNFLSLVKEQGWATFLSSHDSIHPDWVYYFSDHVRISFGSNFTKVKIIIQYGDHSFIYNSKNFLEDFGLESRGFNAYPDKKWPDELPSFLDVSLDLKNHREFPPGVEKDHTIPQFQLFDGEDKFATKCMGRAIVPIGTQDRRVPMIISSLLYNFKNRLRINLSVIIGSHMNYAMTNARATTLSYGMLEIEEASLEDRVQIDLIRGIGYSSGNVNENVEGENDDDEIREENVGGEDLVHREVAHDEAGVLAEMRRLSDR
ncbi:hypothetical protein LIER_11384 [Lithospermum erythrorhizon]|uniref:Uncharacterized protein n=1 Tax=Lithospermum erythrorhizon TaxID=34254 RepID=A0AAV3PPA0_LITER